MSEPISRAATFSSAPGSARRKCGKGSRQRLRNGWARRRACCCAAAASSRRYVGGALSRGQAQLPAHHLPPRAACRRRARQAGRARRRRGAGPWPGNLHPLSERIRAVEAQASGVEARYGTQPQHRAQACGTGGGDGGQIRLDILPSGEVTGRRTGLPGGLNGRRTIGAVNHPSPEFCGKFLMLHPPATNSAIVCRNLANLADHKKGKNPSRQGTQR